MGAEIVVLDRVQKIYPNGSIGLKDISFTAHQGDFWLITGHSGSGKSTLLKLLYGAESATSGEVRVGDTRVNRLNPNQLPQLRRQMGIVFQDYRLIAQRTVWQNVALVLECQGFSFVEVKKRVAHALKSVNLDDRGHCYPNQLSGGEQQRVGIARAIVHSAPLILADEPTGNLDPENTFQVMQIFQRLHQSGMTILVTTHDRQWVNSTQGSRVLELNHGRIKTNS